MSGEGLIPGHLSVVDRAEAQASELADVIAWLAQRRDNAALLAERFPLDEPLANDRRRQLEIVIDELAAGLHEGHAAVRAALAEKLSERSA